MITGKMLKGYSFFSSLNQEFLDKVASLGQFVQTVYLYLGCQSRGTIATDWF
jgi:hypothetical protein